MNTNIISRKQKWAATGASLAMAIALCGGNASAQDEPAAQPASPPAAAAQSAAPTASAPVAEKHKPTLPSIDYQYGASFGGMNVGKLEVTLEPDVGNGDDCYRYSTLTNPSAMVAALYGSPNQISQFCVKDGKIHSQHFNSILPGDEKQSYTLNFDWDKLTVTDGAGQVRPIPQDAIDSFALQQAVRLWVVTHAKDANPPAAEFTMVDHKNLTHYILKLSGHEQVTTPAGTFDALKMERIDNPKKEGIFWLAADRQYMPVRIQTRNGFQPAVVLQLLK